MVTNEDIKKIRLKYPVRITRSKSIKLYCKECCSAGDNLSWRNCTFKECFLWNYRLGREVVQNQIQLKPQEDK